MRTFAAVLLLVVAAYAAELFNEEESRRLRESSFIDIPIRSIAPPNSSPQPRDLKEQLLKAKKLCGCKGKSCNCCYQVSTVIVPVYGCAHITVDASAKTFELKFTVGGIKSYSSVINVEKLEKACKKIPKLESIEICMYATLEENTPDNLTSCMSLDILHKGEAVAIFNFQCMTYNYKLKQLSYTESKTEREAIAKMKIKHPVDLFTKLFKALIN